MFSNEQLETASIVTLSTRAHLAALMSAIKSSPKDLRDAEGPRGKRPSKLHVRELEAYNLVGLCASYGRERNFMIATLGDTLINYADGSFCILPTGTPASIHPPVGAPQR